MFLKLANTIGTKSLTPFVFLTLLLVTLPIYISLNIVLLPIKVLLKYFEKINDTLVNTFF